MFYPSFKENSKTEGRSDMAVHNELPHLDLQCLQNSAVIIFSLTLMCLSIGTPKNDKFSICPKWKIHNFQVSQTLGRVQPHYNLFEYWET